MHTWPYLCVRDHTPMYVTIALCTWPYPYVRDHTTMYVTIPLCIDHTPVYVTIPLNTWPCQQLCINITDAAHRSLYLFLNKGTFLLEYRQFMCCLLKAVMIMFCIKRQEWFTSETRSGSFVTNFVCMASRISVRDNASLAWVISEWPKMSCSKSSLETVVYK